MYYRKTFNKTSFESRGWKKYFSNDYINFDKALRYPPNKYILTQFFTSGEATIQGFHFKS